MQVRTATTDPTAPVPHVDPGGVRRDVELELTRAMKFATCHGAAVDARPDTLHAHVLIATDCQSHDDVAITVLTNEREPIEVASRSTNVSSYQPSPMDCISIPGQDVSQN